MRGRMHKESPPTVYVVDDDPAIQQGLDALFRSVGHRVEIRPSASAFLQGLLSGTTGCLVLDIRLPGLSGLGLQSELLAADIHLPIVFMTGYGDIPMTVSAMRAGAVDFLEKPFRHQDMLDAVNRALERDRERWEREERTLGVTVAYGSLTARERDVMAFVVRGFMNKQIAAEIGISEITVKQHRSRVMKKMGFKSLADLVRAAGIICSYGPGV